MSGLGVLVSGMVAGVPGQGGATWAVLQYLLGLRRLGHRVTLVELVEPAGATSVGDSAMAAYCEKVMSAFGLDDDWALLDTGSGATAGLGHGELRRRARDADVLLNVSGMLVDEALVDPVPVRAYLDLDPAFNQLWHEVEGIDMRFDGHTHFVTVGLSVGREGCPVPTCGRRWLTTLPPVVLDEWRVADDERYPAFTTVGNFRGYGSIRHGDVVYGQKAHSLRALADVPGRTGKRFVLAMAIHPEEQADLALLRHNGWELVDPASVAGTPDDYRRFVQGSRAEFGVAKCGYVVSRSGWFSDRSACYLASGRPVLAQDTGFPAHLPTGEGLLAFADTDGAAAAVDTIEAQPRRHRRAARALAEEHLDSDRVLGRLLEQLAAAP